MAGAAHMLLRLRGTARIPKGDTGARDGQGSDRVKARFTLLHVRLSVQMFREWDSDQG